MFFFSLPFILHLDLKYLFGCILAIDAVIVAGYAFSKILWDIAEDMKTS